jgi:hypothetical protein
MASNHRQNSRKRRRKSVPSNPPFKLWRIYHQMKKLKVQIVVEGLASILNFRTPEQTLSDRALSLQGIRRICLN